MPTAVSFDAEDLDLIISALTAFWVRAGDETGHDPDSPKMRRQQELLTRLARAYGILKETGDTIAVNS